MVKPTRRRLAVMVAIALAGCAAFFWFNYSDWFPRKHASTVLVLEDCDPDYKTPTFGDAVFELRPDGASSRLVTNLNLCETVGGHRALSVSPDGRFCVAQENVGAHLAAYDTQTGSRLWRHDGYDAAVVGQDDTVYAFISSGTIQGGGSVVIKQGQITKRASPSGFDLALDEQRGVLWMVGKNIKKCDLDLNVLMEVSPIGWCGVSVGVNPDGSLWVAERQHPDVPGSTNRLFGSS